MNCIVCGQEIRNPEDLQFMDDLPAHRECVDKIAMEASLE